MKLTFLFAVLLSVSTHSFAQSWLKNTELGIRYVAEAANGVPSNDVLGYGIFAKKGIGEGLKLGFAADISEYDVEEPAKILGLVTPADAEAVDAVTDGTFLSAWIESSRPVGASKVEFRSLAGLGFALLDQPDVRGETADGRGFDINGDIGADYYPFAGIGFARQLGNYHIGLDYLISYHFTDWKMTDRISGETGKVDDYGVQGFRFSLGRQF